MTRQMKEQIVCPICGNSFSNETAFSRWVRLQSDLDANRDGIVLYDCDMIVHRYKFDHDRLYQCIMVVEIKAFGAELSLSQHDTLGIFGQFLRNDKTTKQKRGRARVESRPVTALSTIRNRKVVCRAFGVHVLTLEKTDPNDSEWIKWDKKIITTKQLIGLLKFEIHPETLRIMDGRKHHKRDPLLFVNTSAQQVLLPEKSHV